ncbi:MAG: UDP-3-O-(3-hydroxymyristoyl)glucosamine N-acyltransferase [Lentisphaerae bacterium]|nr:UDP-3-O-(3-hydroxymyristoyl)glucosamine N-acyltransferase [Lentisphaerota bacterium]
MSQPSLFTPAALAAKTAGRLDGLCPVETITGAASLADAGPTDVTFLANEKYGHLLSATQAPLVLVPVDYPEPPPQGKAWVRCQDPSKAFTALVMLFAPPPPARPAGIHLAAVVDATARIAASAHIGACAVIAANAVIGERTIVMPGTFIGENAVIGDDCLIYPNVTIRERCIIGQRVILHPGVVIGADGFGYDSDATGHSKIPQLGIVEIGDDVEIGANSCVDRARFGVTRIGDGTKIDNLVQIGHNVVTGKACMIVAQVGIAGSTTIGNGVVLAGQAGVVGHLKVGDGAIVMAKAGVTKDLPPKAVVFGMPAADRREFARDAMFIRKLPEICATLKKLQSELDALKKQ